MNAVAQLFGKTLAERVARSTLPRSEAIAVELAAEVPANLAQIGKRLAALRERRAAAWNDHRAAIAAYQRDQNPTTKRAVKTTQDAMDALDEPIGAEKQALRNAREKAEPAFLKAAKTLHPNIADQLEQAYALLASAGADMAAIDSASIAAGMQPPARMGRFPDLAALRELIDGLRA